MTHRVAINPCAATVIPPTTATRPWRADTDVRVVTREHAAPDILEIAASDVDLIVTPMHPRGAVSRALLGSVVDKVMRGVSVPLLLFRASLVDEAMPANTSRRPWCRWPSTSEWRCGTFTAGSLGR